MGGQRKTISGKRAAGGAIGLAIVALLGTASCSSSDADESRGATSASAVADAERLIKDAQAGLVYAPVDSGNSLTEVVPQTGWEGPGQSPTPAPGVKVQFVICAAASVCETVSDAGEAAAAKIGWSAETIAGNGDAASYNAAMDTAISRKPDAIINVGVPGRIIADKLDAARKAGIVTVSAPDVPVKDLATQPYDGYVSYRQPLQHQLMAAAIIADSQGTGAAIEIRLTDQPDSLEGADQFKRVMDSCAGCATYFASWTVPDASDATKAGNIIDAALQAHPDATYLAVPNDIGLPAVIAAVGRSGRDIKILAKDGTRVELDALRRGDLFAVPGVSLEWLGYAALFQANLGINDQPYLDPFDQGLGVHLFTKDNVPNSEDIDYSQWVDFAGEYEKLWGVS